LIDDVVLLVEDNSRDEILTVITLAANKVCNDIVIARDGAAAMTHLFGANPVQPALVLLDLHLPRVDGSHVLEHLRTNPRTRHVPVMLLVGWDEEADHLALTWDHVAFLTKPIAFDRFMSAARALGLQWQLRRPSIPDANPGG
jgi:two-component system response regulator